MMPLSLLSFLNGKMEIFVFLASKRKEEDSNKGDAHTNVAQSAKDKVQCDPLKRLDKCLMKRSLNLALRRIFFC